MTTGVRTERRAAAGAATDVVVLTAGDAVAEVWPGHGFNGLRWAVGGVEVLYAAAEWATNPVPTRSGVPVLFPFPNRIRAGTFSWAGRDYALPLNDSTRQNAIHGFAPRRPWRVVRTDAGGESASVSGEFRGSVDAADAAGLWPADYALTITYTLTPSRLAVAARVENPDKVPLPFGLGFHPYFRLSGEDDTLQVAADRLWELDASLPTGTLLPADGPRDLRRPRPLKELTLDDVYTGLGGGPAPGGGGMIVRSRLARADGHALELHTTSNIRELVLFTPPHRQAVCVEPYTCTTDAVNLQQRGVDAGWEVLPPGGAWEGGFVLAWS